MNLQNAQALLVYANDSNIKFMVRDNKLVVKAPKGRISPDLERCLKQHKQWLCLLLGRSIERTEMEIKKERRTLN